MAPILTVVDSKNPLAQAISAISHGRLQSCSFRVGAHRVRSQARIDQDVAGTPLHERRSAEEEPPSARCCQGEGSTCSLSSRRMRSTTGEKTYTGSTMSSAHDFSFVRHDADTNRGTDVWPSEANLRDLGIKL